MLELNERTTDDIFGDIPDNINFDVAFEPTLVPHKKYVLNESTGEYLNTVGHKFNCADHPDYIRGVRKVMLENLDAPDLEGVTSKFSTARNGAWMMMDIVFPNVKVVVETPKHKTEISQRVIALHGIDGSCSNQVFYGGIDAFCTNGMISGEYDMVRRKNTLLFSLDRFIDELRHAKQDFYEHGRKLQTWASTHVDHDQVKQLLEEVLKSDRKADKMLTVYNREAAQRGPNLFSLYSAFTNYASHANESNGFKLRETGNDTQAQSMFRREQDVSKWIASPQFYALELAA
jgi:hypothetical protein